MWRGHDSVLTVVEEEKYGNTISIQTQCFLGGARPVAAFMPRTKGRMAHSLWLASWKAATPTSFDA